MNKRLSNIDFASLGIIFVTQVSFAAILGAVYWYDSIVYLDQAYHFLFLSGYQTYAQGHGAYFYSHVTPGIPLLWAAAIKISGETAWFSVMTFQRTVAGISLFIFSRYLGQYVGTWGRILFLIILSINPFISHYTMPLLQNHLLLPS